MKRLFRYLTLLLLYPGYVFGQSGLDSTYMSIVDLIDMPSISWPQISPDGSQILYRRTDADWDENKTVSHIWRAEADGSGSIQLTNGKDGESGAVWSPDGGKIAFVAKRNDDEHGQIWLMNNEGGEGIRLSEHPTGVSSLIWAPDGSTIYFLAKDEKTEEEKAREKIDDNVFRFEEDEKDSHIWQIDVQTGETQRRTSGDFSVLGYTVSRDGSLLAYMRAPTSLLDDLPNSEIWVTTVEDTAGARQITDNAVFESGIRISPDNSEILFTANTNDDLTDYYYNDRLFVASLINPARPRCLVCGGEYAVNLARWSNDGAEVFFLANTGIRTNLYRVSPTNGEITPFTVGDHAVVHWDYQPRVDLHAVAFSSPESPGDILVTSSDDVSLTQVTHVFDYIGEQFELPKVEIVSWQGEDGVPVEGLVYLPMDYEEGMRYPLVVQTHGGPASSDVLSFFNSLDYETVLTGMGYVVFKPNYRGSTGYGDEFLRDMVGHYFNQAHKDVMTGVDFLIDRGLVDEERMAKMGWSAGGHMTNKIVTHTDRFKAASSGAGAINWISMYAQSDIRIYRTPWFGGDPWSDGSPIEQYLADSPLFDVHNVTTPTIVLVGEDDPRVPMPQSVELYRALKKNGVPTHLYVAPAQGHGWRELQQRLFKANVELDWFERWVRGQDYEWETSPRKADDDDDDDS